MGTIFNMVNILVLTHKDMRTNPINLLLTGIAIADMLVMLDYIPFAIHMYLLQGSARTMEEKVRLVFEFSENIFFSVFLQLGSIPLVSWKLLHLCPHSICLVHPGAGHLEADHGQVPHHGRHLVHHEQVLWTPHPWLR